MTNHGTSVLPPSSHRASCLSFNLKPLCFYLFEQKGRALRCSKSFLKWLQETCPEVTDVMPTNDKKFKGRAVTRFLLDELEEQYVAPLLDVSYTEDLT